MRQNYNALRRWDHAVRLAQSAFALGMCLPVHFGFRRSKHISAKPCRLHSIIIRIIRSDSSGFITMDTLVHASARDTATRRPHTQTRDTLACEPFLARSTAVGNCEGIFFPHRNTSFNLPHCSCYRVSSRFERIMV